MRRIRFTRKDVERMLEAGVLEGRRFELIEGELVEKMGQNPLHIYVLRILQAWLTGIFGTRVQSLLSRPHRMIASSACLSPICAFWPMPGLNT